ncbi:MAG: magnesium transporter [Lachnospiraceae bacterium]|nr:magnesium transporter [Lachnospiraceae bacterium]
MEELNIFEKYLALLENGKYLLLKEELNEDNPANVAEFFEELDLSKQLFVFRFLTKDMAAEVFSYMDGDTQENIVKSITDSEIRNILAEMFLDDTVDFLSEMPADLVTKVLKNTDETKRKLINQFLNYPEDSAGSLMTIEFVQFYMDMTVKAAMEQLKVTGIDKETIYNCYVVNEKRMLIGVLPLRELLFASGDTLVKELMEDRVIKVTTLDDQEIVADIFKKYNFIALPVVDGDERLVGIITVDDIVDVIEEENTEDFEKMAALIPAEEEYLKAGVFSLAKNRIIWLLVLMISGTISSLIISNYESLISSVVMLAAFMPILMDTGGNAGSQASTLIIRGMALSEIEEKDILKVIWKEIRVGLLTGLSLAVVNFIRLALFESASVRINLTVSLSLIAVVVLAKVVGSILPMVAKKMKLDPAMMAGPLMTTVVDAMSLIIYFKIAQILIL